MEVERWVMSCRQCIPGGAAEGHGAGGFRGSEVGPAGV